MKNPQSACATTRPLPPPPHLCTSEEVAVLKIYRAPSCVCVRAKICTILGANWTLDLAVPFCFLVSREFDSGPTELRRRLDQPWPHHRWNVRFHGQTTFVGFVEKYLEGVGDKRCARGSVDSDRSRRRSSLQADLWSARFSA